MIVLNTIEVYTLKLLWLMSRYVNLPKRKRERAKEAQTGIGQREQNFILVSPVLKDKIREGREIF